MSPSAIESGTAATCKRTEPRIPLIHAENTGLRTNGSPDTYELEGRADTQEGENKCDCGDVAFFKQPA